MDVTDIHRHLGLQLGRLGLSAGALPTLDAWVEFLGCVDRAYTDIDQERLTLERSVGLFEREMRELNASLEAERDRIRLIFEVAPVGIVRWELDGRITMANPAFERMLGFSSSELLGLGGIAEIIHPDERDKAREAQSALVAPEGSPAGTTSRRFTHQDGRTIHANVSTSVALDAHRRPLFIIALVEDVSDKARLEIELRHAQKLESVGRLAAGIAHELNTPIQFIGDNATFLQTAFTDVVALLDRYRAAVHRLGDAVPSEVREELGDAEGDADLDYLRGHVPGAFDATLHGVERVSRIVKAMKAFAHPDEGQKAVADLNQALRNTLTVGNNELKYVAEVETEFGELGLVECNLGEVNQVFLNLLVNAAHAIGDAIGDSGIKGKIRVRTFRESDVAVVAVSDTGTGIPERIRNRIFDPFFTTKEVGKGTGQGLAISRSVVEKHGGTLTFETEEGRGTTFFVRLPASRNGGEDVRAA